MAGKWWKNTYQAVSLVILSTKGNLGHRNQGRRKSYRCNNIYSATFNHRFWNVQQIQFHTQHSFSLPIINASRRTSSHTLTAATTTKTPLLHWSIKSLSNLLCVPENWALAKQLPVRKKF